jgi:nitronate monooxygenase
VTLRTPFTERFGVERPVAQAPVGSVTCPELAAAVSAAGGLGSLAVTWQDHEATRAAIRTTRERTDAPFAVNLVLDERTTPRPTDDHLAACLDAGAPIVTFSFGDPAPYVERVHAADALAIAMVGGSDAARAAADAGVDAVVAQGWEAGGHADSEVATLPLVPRVADAVDVPVLAAGGISDGRGMAAALALGADGAYLGTRFVATKEALAHPDYRELLLEADETDTVRTDLFNGGWPERDHRVVRNSTVESWAAAGRPAPDDRPRRRRRGGDRPPRRTPRRVGTFVAPAPRPRMNADANYRPRRRRRTPAPAGDEGTRPRYPVEGRRARNAGSADGGEAG